MSELTDRILSKLDHEDREAIKKKFDVLETQVKKIDKIIEGSPICTKIIDLDRKLKYMSCGGVNALKIPDITVYYGKPYPPQGFPKLIHDLYDEHFPLALKGEATSFECPIPDMEGHEEWYMTNFIPIYDDSGENLEFILASSANITVRKRMEEEIVTSQRRMMQAEKMVAVGQLGARIAHEVNNPIGIILLFAQAMEKRLVAGDPMQLPVSSIVREALRCRDLVQEMLIIAREGQTQFKKIDLNEIMKASVEILKPRALQRDVSVIQEPARDLPEHHGNRTQIQQVFLNLGANAIDATPKGGKITMRTLSNGGDMACFEIADNGSGIPVEDRRKIFDPFYTTKDTGKGIGLGLSLAYKVVRMHDGNIVVHERDGGGTVMRVELSTKIPAAAE